MPKRAPPGAAWAPAPYDIKDIAAVQAMARGEADAAQQARALKWIIEVVAGTYDQSYRPDSERDTAFAEGRRFVGLSLVKATKLNTQHLREQNVGSN